MKDADLGKSSGPLTMSAPEASEWFDALAACPQEVLRGHWRGREIYTGHPLDGVLANVSWYGKRFDEPDRVHPLVVVDAAGTVFPLNPALIPMRTITSPPPLPRFTAAMAPRLMSATRRLVAAKSYGADLSEISHRGKSSAAMRYRDKPIVDYFRLIGEDTVLGAMEYPGMPRPYYFVLGRDRDR